MADNTPKNKEEMELAIEDLQLDPEDLEAVSGGDCSTCYTEYTDPKGGGSFVQ